MFFADGYCGLQQGEYFLPGYFNRIFLGTIQIGLGYGLNANRPDRAQSFRLLDAAWDRGIRCFDTARAYGEAESRIGQWIRQSGRKPTIVSKIPRLQRIDPHDRLKSFNKYLDESLKHLNVERIDYCLSHDVLDFYESYYRDRLSKIKHQGMIGDFGVSCYTPTEAIKAIDLSNDIGMVQLPSSVLDRRAESVQLAMKLRKAEAIMVARSLFLQGTLLLPEHKLPPHLQSLAPSIQTLSAIAAEHDTTVQCLAIAYVLKQHADCCIVIGFRSSKQLNALDKLPDNLDDLEEATNRLALEISPVPDRILDPRTWPK